MRIKGSAASSSPAADKLTAPVASHGSGDIAIVGRSCRLPGAPSVADLWTMLAEGRCGVSRIPDDRWSLERLIHPRGPERGKTYTWSAGTLDDIWGFDPAAFGLSPREAEQMDPQQRLLLELTWEALEDAGIKPSAMAGSDTGVFIGASALDHANLRILDIAAADAYMMTGNTLSVISNRISYIFDLHGPSFTVDTACSSALVALNEAVVSLRSGRVDTAIVGGINILASPHSFVGFSQASMLSRRGLCQAFSANADGYVRSEGGAVVVLRTREAAERAGDRVYAHIVASDVNSDGRTNGISLPSKAFQARLLERLYLDGGLDLDAIAFIEAHGTGTPVGDPIEAMAIGETLARGRAVPLPIGSVKTNIGHMEAASGLGGLLKAMLALEHDLLPASLHSDELNPNIDFAGLNLAVAREAVPLARRPGKQRLAGINSFGFGGTNAHVVLADVPVEPSTGTPPGARADLPALAAAPSYLVLSAHSRAALGALVADYATRLEVADEASAAAIVAATGTRRDRLAHRLVIPVAGRAEMAAMLDRLCDEDQAVIGAARGTAIERAAPVCFVFSGNGSQFAGMGLVAYKRNAVFRARIEAISVAFEALAGWSIVETLHADDLATRLELTQISQPLLFAVQSAACHALAALGLTPSFVVGHSVGEVAAAEAAGILDAESALKTIFSRSLHQELTLGLGGMAVVIGSRETTEAILQTLPGLGIAACNSPRAFTVSGVTEDIEKLSDVARRHKARIRKLDLRYPFHSALMAPVERPLLRSLAGLRHSPPSRASFLSTVTGAKIERDDLDAHYWWRNVREPVLFSDAITAAVAAGARVFVEIGPNPTLLSHVNDTIEERTATIATLGIMEKRDKGGDPLVAAVAVAIARGAAIDEAKAFGSGPAAGASVALPTYPWQRKTYRLPDTVESPGLIRSAKWHPLIGARYGADTLEWRSSLDTSMHPWLADHCVDGRAILPGAAFAEMALAVARDWLGSEQATIADLEISSPMQLTPDASREVLCRLSPLISQLEILSRPRLGQTPWQTHATAKILRDATVGVLPETDDRAPLSPSHPVTGTEIYAMAERAGLHYGPSFRKLATASAVRPDRIVLDLTKEDGDPSFGVDPARMDACFHALVLIFSSLRDAVHGTAYIPVRFGEIMLRRPGATFTRARIDVLRRDERIIIANFLLTDAAGDIVVFMREARFQAIRTTRAADAVKQMIYQTAVLASEPTAARNDKPVALSAFRAPDESDAMMADDFVLLEGWATALALQTARDLATANFIDVEALVATGRLPGKTRPWLENVLVSLDRSGLCHKDRLGRHIDPEVDLPDPNEILRTIAHEHQDLSAELLVAASTVTAIRAIVAGTGDALGRPLSVKVIDGFELGSSQAHAAAASLGTLLRASAPSWPRDRAMRILQVGYGPLTSVVVPIADAMQAQVVVVDPDRRRLERARMSFADRGDVGFVDKVDELPSDGFDLVVAAGVLHRHRHRPGFWAGLRRAMAPGALLAAVEPSPSFFRDLVLGLDACLAGDETFDGISVSDADWLETMQAVGLGGAQVSPIATDAGSALLLTAQLETERRHWSGSGNAIIVGDGEAGTSQTMSACATLLASAGVHVTMAFDGEIEAGHLVEAPAFVIVFAHEPSRHVSAVKGLSDQCMRLKRVVDALGSQATRIWLVTAGATISDGEAMSPPVSGSSAGPWRTSDRPSMSAASTWSAPCGRTRWPSGSATWPCARRTRRRSCCARTSRRSCASRRG